MKSEDSQVKSGSLFSERTGNAPPAQLVRLTPAVYAAILAHGEETYPDECCGALLGHFSPEGWRIEAAVRAGNARADSAHNRYQIAPDDLVKIEREARRMLQLEEELSQFANHYYEAVGEAFNAVYGLSINA